MPDLSEQLKRRDLSSATITPVVRIDNLPCTLYNKVCQANVILTKRLIPGRLHDFAVRVRDTKGDSNSMQATISATNATTSRDKIFPHIPSLIMVPEVIIVGTSWFPNEANRRAIISICTRLFYDFDLIIDLALA